MDQFHFSEYTKWEISESTPNIEIIKKLANYFNVSIDYLVGNSDIKNINYKQTIDPDAPFREKNLTAALLKISEMAHQFDLDNETAFILIRKAFEKFGLPKPPTKDCEAASGLRYPGTGALDKKKEEDDA